MPPYTHTFNKLRTLSQRDSCRYDLDSPGRLRRERILNLRICFGFSGFSCDDLGYGEPARKEFDEHESDLSHDDCLRRVCLSDDRERCAVCTNRAGRVYAGFEKLQLQPIVDRYLRIADVSEYVTYLDKTLDSACHPNIRVTLNADFRLAREWFQITQSPTLRTAFLAFDEAVKTRQCPSRLLLGDQD